jgi:uncharacterized protein (TIGR02118 family)
MVKLTFLFNEPEDRNAFDDYFFNRHLPLHSAIKNVKRREIARVLGAPDGSATPYHLIAEYYFDSMEALREDFTSEGGATLNQDLANFAGAGFTVFVSQIHET